MSTTNWSSQAGMGDGDSGDVTSGSTTIDTNWTQSSGMTDVSDAEEANIVELVERAETAATNAETAETNAETAETNAETAETGAETAKTGAETAKTAAEAAQTASEAAQTAAETAESNAETAYANTLAIYGDTTDVQDAVDSASTSATNAATSATSASTSATSASTSASAAATSATAAATSATSSASSASTSNTSALAAQTAEANAETAEANAITARLAAESAESNAEGSATQAANSATSASSSASQALSSKNAAAASESAAATSAYNAGVSESNASTSEDNAATSESNSASSATAAASSASSAASSATDAETAQTAAESAQVSAEAVYDSFDDRYLGSKSSDPTLDNDGDALLTGALYFNTTESEMRVYTGSAWEPIQELSGDQTVNSLTSNNDVVVKGNLEVQGTTITVDSATAQTIDLGDNDRIRLGDSDDLQIYHDGTKSYISDTGTGTLDISTNGSAIRLVQGNGNRLVTAGYGTAGVKLWYGSDDTEKLATTSTGVDVTGNITVSGTVDGRDVAADGATLDAVASTYVDVSGDTLTGDLAFGDNVKATFGASDDLQIYHDGSHSYIKEVGTGNLRFDADNWYVRSADGSEAKIAAITNGAVSLYYDGTVKLATTSSGVDITGTVVADEATIDGDIDLNSNNGGLLLNSYGSLKSSNDPGSRYALTLKNTTGGSAYADVDIQANGRYGVINLWTGYDGSAAPLSKGFTLDQNNDISFYEDTGTTAKLTWDASAEELQFKDGVAAEFGDGGDFQIEHNGTNTKITNNTGTLKIVQNVNDGDVEISSDDGSGATALYFVADGSTGEAILYHYGSQKLATKSTGINVTGTITADGLVVDGDASSITFTGTTGANSISAKQGFTIDIDSDNNQGAVDFRVTHDGGTNLFNIDESGDISFYDDSGSSQDFYWDASTSRLGLGTTGPSGKLHLAGPHANQIFRIDESTSGYTYTQGLDNTGVYFSSNSLFRGFRWSNGGSERMRIDSSGNVGIGTTSPEHNLHISSPTGNATIQLEADRTGLSTINFADVDNNDVGQIEYEHSNNAMSFSVANTQEAMRIDSSGNLLVGTTSTTVGSSSTLDGIALLIDGSGGTLTAARSGTVARLNRQSSDGEIINFRKDGTTIGSIGVDNTDNIFLSGNSGHSGLMVGTPGIIAYANGNVSDATEDLGQSSVRWRNLYLSGGIYLGGTVPDNLLDDYEEGTWTPSFNGYSTGFTGRYTKIGNIVHCQIERILAIPSGSITGSVTITGLPFVAQRSYTPLLGHIRAASSTRPFGIIRNSSIGLVTDSVFGSNSYYNETHANYDGSNLTQNGITAVYIAWEFTYRQG